MGYIISFMMVSGLDGLDFEEGVCSCRRYITGWASA